MLATFHRSLKYFDTATGAANYRVYSGRPTRDDITGTCIYAAWGKISRIVLRYTDRSTTNTASIVLNPTQTWQAFSEFNDQMNRLLPLGST
jgi:hypothetical protein